MRLVHATTLLATCASLALTGCDDEDPAPSIPDAGDPADAGRPDAGSPDAGPPDAGPTGGPFVTTSQPAEGATGVLPVELYKVDAMNTGLRKVVTLGFSEPMDTSLKSVTLVDVTTPATPARVLEGTWSSDALTLTVAIPRPESDLPPLEQENRYSLDVTALKDAQGRALDATHAGLGDGKLDFETGRRDPDLEHACTHALLATPEAVTAGDSPTSFYPATDTGHIFYGLTLPGSAGNFLGYTEVVSAPSTDQHIALYLAQPIPIAVHDTTEGEVAIDAALQPATPVCVPAITHALRFIAPRGDRFLRLTFGPTATESFTFVVERY